jgi:hypothetical protein
MSIQPQFITHTRKERQRQRSFSPLVRMMHPRHLTLEDPIW